MRKLQIAMLNGFLYTVDMNVINTMYKERTATKIGVPVNEVTDIWHSGLSVPTWIKKHIKPEELFDMAIKTRELTERELFSLMLETSVMRVTES